MTVPGRCRRGSYGAISGDWRDHPEIVLSFPRVACLPTLRPACIHVGPIDSSSLSTPDFSSEYVVDRAGSECVITTTGVWSILIGQERRLAVERQSISLFTVRWKKVRGRIRNQTRQISQRNIGDLQFLHQSQANRGLSLSCWRFPRAPP